MYVRERLTAPALQKARVNNFSIGMAVYDKVFI
jgi:hypothetical protein